MNEQAPHNPNEMVLNWARTTVLAVPTIYDKNGLWWLWSFRNYQYEETDETELLNILRQGNSLGDSVLVKKNYIITALQLEARGNMPPELPANKIQFRDKVYDLETGEVEPILENHGQPKYFTTNSIPHILGATEETPILDRLFTDWVGQENIQTLYEVIAYCAYRQYPIHRIIVLNGSGRNGKSTFLRVLENFLGEKNLASTDFERLASNRFETFSLYRKLGAIMGETNFNVLKNTSLLKRLSGDDLVQFEKKGGATINAHSYATLMVATNSLPITEDETDGFYRRWVILDFPNEFPEGKDVSGNIPRKEYHNLARKVTRILPELIERGNFTGEGDITERKRRYTNASNPFDKFLKEKCYTADEYAYMPYQKLFQTYNAYLRGSKKRPVARKEFTGVLDAAGLEHQRNSLPNEKGNYQSINWVFGVKLKETVQEFEEKKPYMHDMHDMHLSSLRTPYIETELNHVHTVHTVHTGAVLPTDILTPEELRKKQADLEVRKEEPLKVRFENIVLTGNDK